LRLNGSSKGLSVPAKPASIVRPFPGTAQLLVAAGPVEPQGSHSAFFAPVGSNISSDAAMRAVLESPAAVVGTRMPGVASSRKRIAAVVFWVTRKSILSSALPAPLPGFAR
jgi:hypothetical protein